MSLMLSCARGGRRSVEQLVPRKRQPKRPGPAARPESAAGVKSLKRLPPTPACLRDRPVIGRRPPTVPRAPFEHRAENPLTPPTPLDRAGVARLSVGVGLALAVPRLRVGAAAAAHPDVAGLDRPRLLAGRIVEVRLDGRRRAAQPVGDLLDRQALELPVMELTRPRRGGAPQPDRFPRVTRCPSRLGRYLRRLGFHRGHHMGDRPDRHQTGSRVARREYSAPAAGTALVGSLLECVEDVHIGAPNTIAFAAEEAQGLPRYVDAGTVGCSHSRDTAADLVGNSIP
jgi:hypothetical protein